MSEEESRVLSARSVDKSRDEVVEEVSSRSDVPPVVMPVSGSGSSHGAKSSASDPGWVDTFR